VLAKVSQKLQQIMSASQRKLRASEIKWHVVQNGSGEVCIHKANGPLKKESNELGKIVKITTSRTDEEDVKLKVFDIIFAKR